VIQSDEMDAQCPLCAKSRTHARSKCSLVDHPVSCCERGRGKVISRLLSRTIELPSVIAASTRQLLTRGEVRSMSALPPKADIVQRDHDVPSARWRLSIVAGTDRSHKSLRPPLVHIISLSSAVCYLRIPIIYVPPLMITQVVAFYLLVCPLPEAAPALSRLTGRTFGVIDL
jgi:hypothetical protein